MEALAPSKEGSQFIKEAGGEAFKLCYQCGLCAATCPWNMVRNFIPRRMIHGTQLGLFESDIEEFWQCTTCGACVKRCPRGVEIIDVMKSVRRIVTEFGVGKVPDSLRITVKNISALGNPPGEAPEKRVDWAKGLDVKSFTKDTDLLYFSCCIPAYDPKAKKIAQSTASILKKCGVDFGILNGQENCCGESVRKAGDERVFQTLAQNNINIMNESGVKKILVSSPHCYHTFKNEYPELGGKFEVVHYTQYMAQLIKEGKLKPTKPMAKKVIYQDPCYLGRHNGIYDEPREVLKSIPGLQLVEFPDVRENALCCGGGGGRVWMETAAGERFSEIKVKQAVEVKAEVIAVACPYCKVMFEDAILVTGKENEIKVKDISELIDEAIG
ncbi:MAG: (Fe-S)-binding protein [Dehalococcoidia bacterium]|nr:(Fe-S)-binding protein [Dehalococcoidia bacterium]